MGALSPNTEAQYNRILLRAFGESRPAVGRLNQAVTGWPESSRDLLRAAIKRRCAEVGEDPTSFLAQIPTSFRIKKASRFLTETELLSYEMAAKQYPEGIRALSLIPLMTGLRAAELLTLTRDNIHRAVKTNELLAIRKGGTEQALWLPNAVGLFEELLRTPQATGRLSLAETPNRRATWKMAGEILSPASRITQYHALRDLIERVGEAAQLRGVRPHLLRHGFATRMIRDGAPLPTVQKMLNHSKIETTMRYLHLDTKDAEKYLRTVE